MRKILLTILAVVVVLVLGFVILVSTQPDSFAVSRSTTIATSAEMVFAHVNDLRKWQAWSPWEKLDPDMKKTFEGPPAGEGAVYAWSGDGNVGEGKMTIVESRANERIHIRLDFVKPMQATNDVEFTFAPDGNNTAVTWTMNGRNNFIGKTFQLFMDMDKMVGDQFAKGLADLKQVVERSGQA